MECSANGNLPKNDAEQIPEEALRRQYHCSEIRTMPLNRICPSLALGFYLRDLTAFELFKHKITALSKLEDSFLSVFEKDEPFEQA